MFTSRGDAEPPGWIGPVAAGADEQPVSAATRATAAEMTTTFTARPDFEFTARSLWLPSRGDGSPHSEPSRTWSANLGPAETQLGPYHLTPLTMIANASVDMAVAIR